VIGRVRLVVAFFEPGWRVTVHPALRVFRGDVRERLTRRHHVTRNCTMRPDARLANWRRVGRHRKK
jgi:hypothetical protein